MDKINFENLPSTATPLNATNMNLLQTYIETELDKILGKGTAITSGANLNNYTTPRCIL